jgi:hypothetical protein
MEDAFVPSIEHSHVVRVGAVDLPVQEPAVLVAAKLTGQKVRPQDELDIAGVLQSGVPLDEPRLRQLTAARPERFDVYLAIRDRIVRDGRR